MATRMVCCVLLSVCVGHAAGAASPDTCLVFYATSPKNTNKWQNPNSFARFSISQSPWTVQKGDVLEYEVLIPKENPEKNGGIDLLGDREDKVTVDHSTLGIYRAVDQNGVSADPATVLEPAVGKWYARKIPLDGLIGQKIRQTDVMLGGQQPGQYVLLVDNVRIRHADRSVTVLYENGRRRPLGFSG